MKLPENTVFASEKFNRYLLIRLPDNDKSIFLESAGYSLQNWQQLWMVESGTNISKFITLYPDKEK